MRRSLVLSALLSLVLPVTGAAADTIPFPGSSPTIQATIDAAPDGSVIQLAPGHYHELLTLYEITRTLTLRGDPANPASVILDGDGQDDAVLRISDSASSLLIEGVTITGGRGLSGNGGAIFMNNSQVVFRDCVFRDNHADMGGAAILLKSAGLFQRCVFQDNTANKIGGAVLVHDGSNPTFEACQFLDNESGVTDPQATYGGALVLNDSSGTFVGCKILRNKAKYAAGGIAVTAPSYDRPAQLITIRDTEIGENTADRADPSLPAAEGGGMHVEDNARVVLDRCWVHDNVAHRGGGLNAYRARYTITDSLIEDNRADAVDGGAGTGGGIYAASVNTAQPTRDPAVVDLVRSVVRRNSAVSGGGMYVQGDFLGLTTNHVSLTITDSLIAENTASDAAGGIGAFEADTTITSSLILSNVVGVAGSYGGGILSAAGSNLTIRTSSIAGNTTAIQGGGIYVDQGGHVDIADSELFANVASSSVGGGALSIGQAVGPVAGPISGSVTRTVIAENGPNEQIYEADCDLPNWSTITYTSNPMHGSANPYYRACNGVSGSVAAFNALAGKASGNTDTVATFARFLAAPGRITAGGTSVLAWTVPGASSLSVDHGVGTVGAPTDSADVAPVVTTTYALDQGPTMRGTATVTLACAALGTPFPRTPAHGGSTGLLTSAALSWYAASGAETYDVYADTTDDPTTIVAQDLTTTSFTLDGLATGTTYHWKVVAKSAACASTSASPVFTFRPSSTPAFCNFRDTFEDGVATNWGHSGKGVMGVVDGALRLVGSPTLMAMAPAAAIGDGSYTVSVLFSGRRRSQARLFFAFKDRRNYRELVVQSTGALQLTERTGRRRKVVARAQRPFTAGAAAVVQIELTGNAVTVAIDDSSVFGGTFSSAGQGRIGVKAVKGPVSIDDVCLAASSTGG